jgi:hypothetical protein
VTGVLGREALEAVAIVAVTTAALAAGRGDERSVYAPHARRRAVSPLAVSLALGAVAIVAAVVVVVVFGGARSSAAPARPEPGLVRAAPWPPNVVSLRARLDAARVPAVRGGSGGTPARRARGDRRRGRPTGTSAQPTRSRSPERPSSPAQFAQQ